MGNEPPHDRQRVERVAGSRRVRLTPAPGTDPGATAPSDDDGPDTSPRGEGSGANDERMRQDVPPHY